MDRGLRDPAQGLVSELQERAKELHCLYEVDELLSRYELPVDETLRAVARALPPGMRYPGLAEAIIEYDDRRFSSADLPPSSWAISATVQVNENPVGQVTVFYREPVPETDTGPFLTEEVRLLHTIAGRLGHYLWHQQMREVRQEVLSARAGQDGDAWRPSVHLLRQTDEALYLRIARRMLNHLCSMGIASAQALLQAMEPSPEASLDLGESNVPGQRRQVDHAPLLRDQVFELAVEQIGALQVLALMRTWMLQDKASFFQNVVENPRSSLPEIIDAIRRYAAVMVDRSELPMATRRSLRVSLTRRILTDQPDFVRVAKEYIRVNDFAELLDNIILPANSHGRLGGKSAGLMLARCVLERTRRPEQAIGELRVPRTWYVASDGILDFIAHNDLQDVLDHRFREVDEIRSEYPNIVQLFKRSAFRPDMVRGLAAALEDLGEVPIIIRSSSLLEDRMGTAFSGKYKSLFLANQGSKAERLAALMDAVAEVYASVFSPDPIEYRRERGLLEYSEEMAVMIQEVIGRRIGRYFLPAFAGVAFSHNEFRWSPRIRREDGLVRLVPGLGTRAVDRVPDDYPILIAPGQPELRVNVRLDEILRYSPQNVDVLNLETNAFETVPVAELMAEYGSNYPGLELVFSVLHEDRIERPVRLLLDPARDTLVVTFQELISATPFVQQLRNCLDILREHLGTPVDIEFAHDGEHFYLLQCRPQSQSQDVLPAAIPQDVPRADVVFSANRYVSNGRLPDLSHIVYVHPSGYGELSTRAAMQDVGRAVGRLNTLLPKRRFLLMGPGRWGSRGDITLGVNVSYSDISNAAMLVEIARQKGHYLPEVSFGTHFFQDLVEAHIRYLPLYPDDPGVQFNERFLLAAPNLLPDLLPDYAHLTNVLRVIDVPAATEGRVLKVLANADLDQALAMLARPTDAMGADGALAPESGAPEETDHWRWRLRMAERIATDLDARRFGVVALYIFGSTKNATAGPGSDIDLLVHFRGDATQRERLVHWFEGWSLCLAELNFLRTGYPSAGLLDVHLVTDEDIAQRNSFAVKIGAVTDAARELPLGRAGGRAETNQGDRI